LPRRLALRILEGLALSVLEGLALRIFEELALSFLEGLVLLVLTREGSQDEGQPRRERTFEVSL